MNYTAIDYSVTDRVLTLTLNRPERLNAFTVTMADELEHAFRRASVDDDVGAVVVTGAGRAFCAGMDLGTSGNVFGLDESLHPTLADMHDRLAAEGAKIGFVFGRLGIVPEACSSPDISPIGDASSLCLGETCFARTSYHKPEERLDADTV